MNPKIVDDKGEAVEAWRDIKHVCERLALKPAKVYELMSDGTLKWFKHPYANKRCVLESDLAALVANRGKGA